MRAGVRRGRLGSAPLIVRKFKKTEALHLGLG
nr:MAG TPA: hypothetical protein [Caudoviricetes sp.]